MMRQQRQKITIAIIGAGQIGSRHLQALKYIPFPLDVSVYDPSKNSLARAKERYDSIPSGKPAHRVRYTTQLPFCHYNDIDIAIISTNSNVRRETCELLLKFHRVKFIILEKLLFQKKSDFFHIQKLLRKKKTKAWVNCPMRMMLFYKNIKNELTDKKIFYHVSGQFGLITNTIHYLDHIVYLTGCSDFTLDASHLEKKPIQSKRKGFLEYYGTLKAIFKNGTVGIFICDKKNNAPMINYISDKGFRAYTREAEQKSWVSKNANGWQWKEIPAPMPYQSQMTTNIMKNLITSGTCQLPTYKESMKIHIQFLEPLIKHLNEYADKKFDYYPFT